MLWMVSSQSSMPVQQLQLQELISSYKEEGEEAGNGAGSQTTLLRREASLCASPSRGIPIVRDVGVQDLSFMGSVFNMQAQLRRLRQSLRELTTGSL